MICKYECKHKNVRIKAQSYNFSRNVLLLFSFSLHSRTWEIRLVSLNIMYYYLTSDTFFRFVGKILKNFFVEQTFQLWNFLETFMFQTFREAIQRSLKFKYHVSIITQFYKFLVILNNFSVEVLNLLNIYSLSCAISCWTVNEQFCKSFKFFFHIFWLLCIWIDSF